MPTSPIECRACRVRTTMAELSGPEATTRLRILLAMCVAKPAPVSLFQCADFAAAFERRGSRDRRTPG